MEVKKICLGLIVLVSIILLCILNRKRILKTYETFTCNLDSDDKTHLAAYYRRCQEEYNLTEVPTYDQNDDNTARELVEYYLLHNENENEHDYFSKFGFKPGWSNQISKRSIMPEWAYYLFKIQRLYLKEGMLDDYATQIKEYINKEEVIEDKSYYLINQPSKKYLGDVNKTKFEPGRELEYHELLLSYFLSKIQRTEISISPTSIEGTPLIWGIPYLMIKNGNKYTSINNYGNVPNFNNYYQIKFVPNLNRDSTPSETKFLGYHEDGSIGLLESKNANSTNSYFEIISANDCNQYIKIKTKGGKYLKINNNNNDLGTGGEKDEYNKIIVSHNIESSLGDLGLDIDRIFIPTSNPNTYQGEVVNLMFKSGKGCGHWLAHLGITSDNKLKVLKSKYNTNNFTNTGTLLPEVFDEDAKAYAANYEGIAFFRTNELINKDKYAYIENRQATAMGNGEGIIEDVGLVLSVDKDNTNAGYVKSGNITTGQKIFPLINKYEFEYNNSNALLTTCEYTGTLTNEDDIKAVCGSNPKCYGMYKEPNTNTKMAYVGSSCDRDLKYFDKYSQNPKERLSRGKINCQLIGEKKEINDDGSYYNICNLPKYNNTQQDNSLKRLEKLKKFTDPNYCQVNLDYGTLDSGKDFKMYVNNPSCGGEYQMAGAPLKGDGRCNVNEKCEFNKFSTDDEIFLINQDFGRIINENLELKNKLNKLSTKVNNFKQNLNKQNDNIETNNKILSDNLNEFKIIKMNDIMNNFNYHTVNKLVDTHK